MRMLLHAVVDTPTGNKSVADGTIAEGIGKAMDMLKPEAAYFFGYQGKRSVFFVFDMEDSSQIPAAVEPLFAALNAEVTLTPCMNIDDLKKGIAALAG
jgi:hypothetical protein